MRIWDLTGIPTLAFLDDRGRFAAVHAGAFTAADLDALVGRLQGGQPIATPTAAP